MKLIDFSDSPGRAFARGFLKGLGAPAMLFADFAPPPLPAPKALPDAQAHEPLRRLAGGDAARLAGDWSKIGADLRAVLARHARAQET